MTLKHNDEDVSSLMKDRSLSQIWWNLNVVGRKGVKESKQLTYVFIAIAITNSVFLWFADPDSLPRQVRFISEQGFRLTSGTLSFLLAGFVFLLNSSNSDLLLKMFRRQHEGTTLDYLRYNTFTLLALFAEYVVATLIFAVILVYGQAGGLFSVLRASVYEPIGDFASKACFFSISMLFILIVVRLKSYITNVYHFAITGLVLKFAILENEEESSKEKQ
jgi:hypothetical protein